ncbi:hypothetical protein A0J61_05077 [Choanephora cucurbitarum]|uniref:Uncharacterized protein n=1 Tax=Choanephora cucurbitarum TaxID=101091 RepID=A0A1C7NCN7_9FUNG|nr:hypothetical protein A0J61_05077 [Choanephora cucurbitarum]
MSTPTANAALMSQLLTESRLGHTPICSPFDPKENINHFELECQRLSLTDERKRLHIGSYLPAENRTLGCSFPWGTNLARSPQDLWCMSPQDPIHHFAQHHYPKTTWKLINKAAVALEESLSSDDTLS